MAKNILHITGHFLPESTGSTIRLYNILSRLPYEVQIYTSDETFDGKRISKKEEKIENINIKRINFNLNKHPLDILPPLSYLYNRSLRIRLMLDMIRNTQFDIIHVHGISFVSKEFPEKSRSSFIYELHAPIDMKTSSFLPKYMIIPSRYYLKRNEIQLIRASHHLITLTQSLKNWINSSYKIPLDKITVVPNGVDVDKFSPYKNILENAEVLKRKMGIYKKKVIMYIGWMDYINGMTDIIKIIPDIIRERKDVCFIFVGCGPEEKNLILLSRLYPSNVKFLNMIPYYQAPNYYQMADLFIIPRPSTISSEMVIPLKLLEAMSMKKIVLGSNVGGINEVIKHGINGFLFDKDDFQNFKNILLEVLEKDNNQIAENARKTVVNNYSWSGSAKILQKVYEDLA